MKNSILQSYCMNYPILQAWNLTLEKPVALVCKEDHMILPTIKNISVNAKIIDLSVKVSTAINYLFEANSEGIFFIVSHQNGYASKKEREKLIAIFYAAKRGEVNGRKTTTAIFLVFKRCVPDEFKEFVFEVHIDDMPRESNLLSITVPPAEMLPIVYDRIGSLCENIGNPIFASICFTYPHYVSIGDLDEYEKMMKIGEDMIQDAELYTDENDFSEMAQRLLEEHISDGTRIKDISKNREIEKSEVENSVFVLDSTAYIHERKFSEIIEPLLEFTKIDIVKNLLHENGILEGKTGDYTFKMSCRINGEAERIRMLRFNLKKLQRDFSIEY